MDTKITKTDEAYYLVVNRKDLYEKAVELGHRSVILREHGLTEGDGSLLVHYGKCVVIMRFSLEGGYDKEKEVFDMFRDVELPFLFMELSEWMVTDSIEEVLDEFPDVERIENMLKDRGIILETDYTNRCGNCHEYLRPAEKYCRHCGTKRGEGRFRPYKNIYGCLYGPPVKVKSKCTACGHIWITGDIGGDYSKFCPTCGKRTVERLEKKSVEFFDDFIGEADPYDIDENIWLLNEKEVRALLESREDMENEQEDNDSSRDIYLENCIHRLSKIGIEIPVPERRYQLTELQAEQMNLANKILALKGTDPNGYGGIFCDKCHYDDAAAISYEIHDSRFQIKTEPFRNKGNGKELYIPKSRWIWDIEKIGEYPAYMCLNCGKEYGKLHPPKKIREMIEKALRDMP